MSCGCDSGYGGYNGLDGVCAPDIPYPIVSPESVPSLIDNLVAALYGAFFDPTTQTGYITKSIGPNGVIVWDIACDPNNTASIAGIPRNQGEGLLCYLLRSFQQFNPASYISLNSVQTLTNKTLTAPVINGGTISSPTISSPTISSPTISSPTISGGTLSNATLSNCTVPLATSAGSATTAGKSTNLIGSIVGSLPYQSATDTTSFLSPGTSGLYLKSQGAGQAPVWDSAIASVANDLSGGVKGDIPYQNAVNDTTFLAPGTAGFVLQSNGAGQAPSWVAPGTSSQVNADNITGGSAGNILYQSSGSNTAKLTNGTTGQLLTSAGASAPTWTTPSSLAVATANDLSGGVKGDIPYQNAVNDTTFLAPGTAGFVLQSNGAGQAPSWVAPGTSSQVNADNITGGSAGNILYQSSGSNTAKLTNGTTGQLLTSAGASAPTWTTPSSLAVATATNLANGSANSIPYQTGSGATAMLAIGTSGKILQSNGSGSAPSWETNLALPKTLSITSPLVNNSFQNLISIPPQTIYLVQLNKYIIGTKTWVELDRVPNVNNGFPYDSGVFTNLEGLIGDFYILPSATSLSFPELLYLQNFYDTLGPGTNALTTLSFPKLISALTIRLNLCPNLTSFPDLSNLEYLQGSLWLSPSPAITSVSLPKLALLGGLSVGTSGVPNLQTISLPSLVSCGTFSAVNFTICPQITSFTFSAVGTLKSYGQNAFTISGCALNLASVQGILAVLASLDGSNGTTRWETSGSTTRRITLTGGTSAGLTSLGISTGTISSASGSVVTVTGAGTITLSAGNTVYVSGSSVASQNGTFTVISASSTQFTYASAGTGTGSTVYFGTNAASQNYAALANRGVVVSLNP